MSAFLFVCVDSLLHGHRFCNHFGAFPMLNQKKLTIFLSFASAHCSSNLVKLKPATTGSQVIQVSATFIDKTKLTFVAGPLR